MFKKMSDASSEEPDLDENEISVCNYKHADKSGSHDEGKFKNQILNGSLNPQLRSDGGVPELLGAKREGKHNING